MNIIILNLHFLWCQEPLAQDPAASSLAAAEALRGGGLEAEESEVVPSQDDTEAVELEHPDLMAESDAHHKKGTFKDPLFFLPPM